MRALIKTREDIGFELRHDHVIDDPVDDEVQIKVSTVSICGSDINIWKWNEAAQVSSKTWKVVLSFNILCYIP